MEARDVLLSVKGTIFQTGLAIQLKQWGFAPLSLPDGSQENLPENIRRHTPHLLVTDWPGQAAAAGLSRQYPHLPVLFLVAHPSLPQPTGNPRHACLPKPCLIAQLRTALQQLLPVALPAADGEEPAPGGAEMKQPHVGNKA